jgi:hypothetical protein
MALQLLLWMVIADLQYFSIYFLAEDYQEPSELSDLLKEVTARLP